MHGRSPGLPGPRDQSAVVVVMMKVKDWRWP